MKQIFNMWPTISAMARDLGHPAQTVYAWQRRGIPNKHLKKIALRGKELGWNVTIEKIKQMKAGEDVRLEHKKLAVKNLP